MALDGGSGGGDDMAGQALTVRRCAEGLDKAEAVRHLAHVFTARKTDTSGGLTTVEDQLRFSECYEVRDTGGGLVGYYALQVNRHSGGNEVVVVAAAGAALGADLVASLIPYIEKQAKGAQALTVHTKRRGLLAKLAALGFQCDGFILRKALS